MKGLNRESNVLLFGGAGIAAAAAAALTPLMIYHFAIPESASASRGTCGVSAPTYSAEDVGIVPIVIPKLTFRNGQNGTLRLDL
jgi:hypothetical protein